MWTQKGNGDRVCGCECLSFAANKSGVWLGVNYRVDKVEDDEGDDYDYVDDKDLTSYDSVDDA